MGKFSEFKVLLKGLADGVHQYNFHLGQQFFANMENTDVRDADLDVKLDVTVRAAHYDLLFHITGTVTVACDRCLDDLQLPIDAEYHVMVEYGDGYNDEADDMIMIPEADAYINVAYMIHDTVALAIPLKHVHPAGKCNRQMTNLLRRHRSAAPADDLENEMLDEIDTIEASDSDGADSAPEATDPRWDALKGLGSED